MFWCKFSRLKMCVGYQTCLNVVFCGLYVCHSAFDCIFCYRCSDVMHSSKNISNLFVPWVYLQSLMFHQLCASLNISMKTMFWVDGGVCLFVFFWISDDSTTILIVTDVVARERATHSCPWEKTGSRRFIHTTSNVCAMKFNLFLLPETMVQ